MHRLFLLLIAFPIIVCSYFVQHLALGGFQYSNCFCVLCFLFVFVPPVLLVAPIVSLIFHFIFAFATCYLFCFSIPHPVFFNDVTFHLSLVLSFFSSCFSVSHVAPNVSLLFQVSEISHCRVGSLPSPPPSTAVDAETSEKSHLIPAPTLFRKGEEGEEGGGAGKLIPCRLVCWKILPDC